MRRTLRAICLRFGSTFVMAQATAELPAQMDWVGAVISRCTSGRFAIGQAGPTVGDAAASLPTRC